MPALQSADLWRGSGRHVDYGADARRIHDGPTNEVQITDIARAHAGSDRDLPLALGRIRWPVRDGRSPRRGAGWRRRGPGQSGVAGGSGGR